MKNTKTPLITLFMLALFAINAEAQTIKFRLLVVASQAKDHWKSISAGKEFFEKKKRSIKKNGWNK